MNENDEQIENKDLPVEIVEDTATDISEQESDVSALATSADQQDAQLQQFAIDFILKVIRLRGVQITRDDFLCQELRRSGYSDEIIENALASTPLEAGVTVEDLDAIAQRVMRFETNKSTALSFASGLPGGFAMVATVPGDIVQYFVYAFRIMQKLAYVYGWKDFIGDLDAVDDETLSKFALFLGVMFGAQGAASALSVFAKDIARPAISKHIRNKALTKTVWYGPMKQVLRIVGIKVTKDSFARTVTKVVPIVSGVISGSMTFASLSTQSRRLHETLRELPAPTMDALEFRQIIAEQEKAPQESATGNDVSSIMKDFMSSTTSKIKATKNIWFGDSEDTSYDE
ncbi:hypothetical protein [Arcanobacterium phocae]|uniref:hypothetical protein n=1 Tax=Arcanobacterium phocae TaxID=131112 RepID=UPI001C0F1FA8|nr:hypothetical protein [Arcanobacterium phocae]